MGNATISLSTDRIQTSLNLRGRDSGVTAGEQEMPLDLLLYGANFLNILLRPEEHSGAYQNVSLELIVKGNQLILEISYPSYGDQYGPGSTRVETVIIPDVNAFLEKRLAPEDCRFEIVKVESPHG